MRKDPDLLEINPREARRLERAVVKLDGCSRVTAPSAWQVHSSLSGAPALTDGDPSTVAEGSDEHRQGEWILIDLGSTCHFQHVGQHHPAGAGVPPRYRIDTAGEHGFPYTLGFVGTGQPGESVATLPRAVDARFIRITIMDDTAEPWLISELEVY